MGLHKAILGNIGVPLLQHWVTAVGELTIIPSPLKQNPLVAAKRRKTS